MAYIIEPKTVRNTTLMMDDANKLVTELYGDSVENSSFFDDATTVKSIYGSQWTGKEMKDFYF